MERHHEVALLQVLDEVYLTGAACIRWDYMYLWFNAERLNKNSYRELNRRWEELCTLTYGYVDAPPLEVLSGKHTLTIRRAPFDGEAYEPLTNWT